jgi:hypothetical protein
VSSNPESTAEITLESSPFPPAQEIKKLPGEPARKATKSVIERNLIPFPKKNNRGRRKKSGNETLRVDFVKASKNTWAFRIRWTEPDGTSPAVYISRVNDKLFNLIKRRKNRYAAFKKQLISSYLSRTVRKGHGTNAGANRAL